MNTIHSDIDELLDTAQRFRSSLHNRQYFEQAFERIAERLLRAHGVTAPTCKELEQALNVPVPVQTLKEVLLARVQAITVALKSASVQERHPDVPETQLPDGQQPW